MKHKFQAKKERYNFNWQDIIFILLGILIVVSLLLYTLLGINRSVSDNSRVVITYQNIEIYNEPITSEKTPLVITREMGVTGDSENNIKPIGRNFDFVGPDVQINIVDKTIQVVQEQSPHKICTNQGVVKYSNTPIICEPNGLQIVILSVDEDVPDNPV